MEVFPPPPNRGRDLSEGSKRPSFLELWAGTGGLSKAAHSTGILVLEPIEAYPLAGYRVAHDLNRTALRADLLRSVKRGDITWLHLGIPCITWSLLRLISVGTRRKGRPQGDGSRDDEGLANGELLFASRLINAAVRAGTFVSLENPKSSLMWYHPFLQKLITRYAGNSVPLYTFDVDQCMFGLGSPAGAPFPEIWRKPTRFLTNIPHLDSIVRRCSHQHVHTPVFGSIKIKGKSRLRSKLAGCYPARLCLALARAAGAALFHGAA